MPPRCTPCYVSPEIVQLAARTHCFGLLSLDFPFLPLGAFSSLLDNFTTRMSIVSSSSAPKGQQRCLCAKFYAAWDDHESCVKCRSDVCQGDPDNPCHVCVHWSPSQWQRFSKRRTYRSRSTSSGGAPPRRMQRAWTTWRRPETPAV